ncbi:major facilitator superfamily domain-containing protein [Aspergillus bertholletiae]|uniref:Major facilitator superfamily domain-containing protein n=1 Tax=Aspergillus bertholletiae TaxID=1226010 RepID=A0A5N7BKJ5_9EURO|nr:major facilitator superfamily domain-containing protein [Aspergillus bertholletiae]
MLGSCAVLPMAGKFYAHFNPEFTFLGFLFLFELGSLLSAVAVSSRMLIVGRAVAGLGSAGIYNGSLTIMGKGMKPSARAWQIGLGTSIATIGSIFGPLIGGGSLSLFDPIGFLLFCPSCILFLLAIQWGGVKYTWDSSCVIGLLCGSAARLVLFVAREMHNGDKAMKAPKMARNSVVFFGFQTVLFQFGSLMVITYYLPLWFQVVKDASPIRSGVMLLPTIIAQTLFTSGYCAPPALIGCALTIVGGGLMTTFVPSTRPGEWIGYQPIIATQAILPQQLVSSGTSIILFGQSFGGAVFTASAQTIFTNRLYSSLLEYLPHLENYLGVGLAGMAFFICFGLGWTHIDNRKTRDKDESSSRRQRELGKGELRYLTYS